MKCFNCSPSDWRTSGDEGLRHPLSRCREASLVSINYHLVNRKKVAFVHVAFVVTHTKVDFLKYLNLDGGFDNFYITAHNSLCNLYLYDRVARKI